MIWDRRSVCSRKVYLDFVALDSIHDPIAHFDLAYHYRCCALSLANVSLATEVLAFSVEHYRMQHRIPFVR